MISLKKQWFSIAIFAVIFIAYLISKTSFFLPKDYASFVKFSLIVGIFLLSGLTIDSFKLLESIRNWRLHLWIQTISFVLFPAVVIFVAWLSNSNDLSNFVYVGFIVLACIPTTITSCVVFTRNAIGNEEASLFNATLGNVLGIVITPILIYFFIGESIALDPVAAIKKLVLLVILPFSIGQVCRNVFSLNVNTALAKSGTNWMILAIMLIAFINAFQQGIELGLSELIYVLLLSLALKLFFSTFAWYSGTLMKASLTLADRKCLTITATQKTLALGLPIVSVLFADNPNLALISLPIIAFHTIQLIIDGILVGQMSEMS